MDKACKMPIRGMIKYYKINISLNLIIFKKKIKIKNSVYLTLNNEFLTLEKLKCHPIISIKMSSDAELQEHQKL